MKRKGSENEMMREVGGEMRGRKWNNIKKKRFIMHILTAKLSCFNNEHLDSILYLSSFTISFFIFLDFQYSRPMIVSPMMRNVKNIPSRIGDEFDVCLIKSLGLLLKLPMWYSYLMKKLLFKIISIIKFILNFLKKSTIPPVMSIPWLLPFWFLEKTLTRSTSLSVVFLYLLSILRSGSNLNAGSMLLLMLNLFESIINLNQKSI